jgi:hypothetical protein
MEVIAHSPNWLPFLFLIQKIQNKDEKKEKNANRIHSFIHFFRIPEVPK